MSQRLVPRTRKDSYVPNMDTTRKSIIELRTVYSELSDTEFCVMYQQRYGVKVNEVKKVLESVEDERVNKQN